MAAWSIELIKYKGTLSFSLSRPSIPLLTLFPFLSPSPGLQVAPAELEAILLGHPKIANCAVIGLPDEMAGEVPKAWVVLREKGGMTADEIQKFVAEKVAQHKRLRGGVKVNCILPGLRLEKGLSVSRFRCHRLLKRFRNRRAGRSCEELLGILRKPRNRRKQSFENLGIIRSYKIESILGIAMSLSICFQPFPFSSPFQMQ